MGTPCLPAFPADWPLHGRAGLRRYAFAYRPRSGLADGVEIAAPWAVVEGEPPRVTALRRDLVPLGIQGVRPLGAAEARLMEREAEVASLVTAPPDTAATALIRDFQCGWARRHGLTWGAIAPLHPGFASWLGCPPG